MPVFNSFQFNQYQFDGGIMNVPVLSTDLVVFDSFSLADNTNMFVQNIQDSEPQRDIIEFKTPRADGMNLIADYWRQKEIVVTGIVTQSTATLLDAYLDTIRQNLRGRAKTLDITRNGVVRRYTATLSNPESIFSQRQGWNITICPFEAYFHIDTPFATDRAYTAISQSMTASPTTMVFQSSGTVHSYPVITLIFDAASSVSVVDIKHLDSSGTTVEEIQYSGSIAANDILVFDGEQRTVTKNVTAVDFSGSFPLVEPGSNLIKITVTGTSFTCYTTIKAMQNYL